MTEGAVATPLLEPADGVPEPIASPRALADAIERFAVGTGPVAIDAERASGYRYSQRAYLVQLKRQGAGIAIIDPITCPDLRQLNVVLEDTEWILHAATQDLPCLADLGLRPTKLFDTELAGRLLGYSKVGLGTLVEELLGLRLEKGHSAADWSRRPLPRAWLIYAALDVEVLAELRESLASQLLAAGKMAWAEEEFAALAAMPPPAARSEPWRRTSGMHRLRSGRQVAAARALWYERDTIAQERDLAPGRVLSDQTIIALALTDPRSLAELLALPSFAERSRRRYVSRWWKALRTAQTLPPTELPVVVAQHDSPPPTNRWAERDPDAAKRLIAVRESLTELAEELKVPLENLLSPELVRRVTWDPPIAATPEIGNYLRKRGAREWQIALTAGLIAETLGSDEALSLPEEVD